MLKEFKFWRVSDANCYQLHHINIISSRQIHTSIEAAVIDGITDGIKYIIDEQPVFKTLYVEDYNISPYDFKAEDSRLFPPSKNGPQLVDPYTTNVFLSLKNYSNALARTNINFEYQSIRVIEMFIANEMQHALNPLDIIKMTATHEFLHLHPLFRKTHCDNPKCLMYFALDHRAKANKLCPECQLNLKKFKTDFEYWRHVYHEAMYDDLLHSTSAQIPRMEDATDIFNCPVDVDDILDIPIYNLIQYYELFKFKGSR